MNERIARRLAANGTCVYTCLDEPGLFAGAQGHLAGWSIFDGMALLLGIGRAGHAIGGGCAWVHVRNLGIVREAGPNGD